MSDYDDDDFENDHDDFNDRTKSKTKKSPSKNVVPKANIRNNAVKDSGYNTFERDHAITLEKPKAPVTSRLNVVNATPSVAKSKTNNILSDKEGKSKLSKQGGIHSSTPNLQSARKDEKKSLLGGEKIATSKQVLTSFGLTKKAEHVALKI